MKGVPSQMWRSSSEVMDDPDAYSPNDEWQETAPPLKPTRVVRGRWSVGFRGGYKPLGEPADLNDMMCDYCGGETHDRTVNGPCFEEWPVL